MAWRFRKSVKILPGVRINLSKNGFSTTVGGRGASINIGKKGTYLNTSIPGTGISSRQKIGGNNDHIGQHGHSGFNPNDIPGSDYAIYKKRQKSTAIAYLLWLFLGLQYGYTNRWGLQILYWLTFGGFLIWHLIDLFRIPGIVKDHNNRLLFDLACKNHN